MGNFDFVRQTLPSVYGECERAESYLISDPRSACFYSRRVVELVVDYLYQVLSLRTPYRDDLSAKINDSAFKTQVPPTITQKLNAIRRIANTAVHDNRQIGRDASLAVLRGAERATAWPTSRRPCRCRACRCRRPARA